MEEPGGALESVVLGRATVGSTLCTTGGARVGFLETEDDATRGLALDVVGDTGGRDLIVGLQFVAVVLLRLHLLLLLLRLPLWLLLLLRGVATVGISLSTGGAGRKGSSSGGEASSWRQRADAPEGAGLLP
jgi:hypothetical protein